MSLAQPDLRLRRGTLALDHRGARLPIIERDERLDCLHLLPLVTL